MKSCFFRVISWENCQTSLWCSKLRGTEGKENRIHTLSLPDRRYSDVHADVGKRFVNQIKWFFGSQALFVPCYKLGKFPETPLQSTESESKAQRKIIIVVLLREIPVLFI